MSLWRVERLGRRGDGVAIGADGRALAPLTLPGEEIEGEAQDGRIAAPRILTPSPRRVRPICAHYRACGGCSLMHADDGFATEWKRQVVETALAAQGLAAPVQGVHVSPPLSRRRAVLSGRRTKKGALLGFHARASDVITDLAQCHVLRPEITAALPLLRQMVMTGASRSAELSITVISGPAGLDVAISGGKALEPALFQDLARLAETGDLARLDWNGQAITRRPPTLPMGRARVIPPPVPSCKPPPRARPRCWPPCATSPATPPGSSICSRAAAPFPCLWLSGPRCWPSRVWPPRWPRWMRAGAAHRDCTESRRRPAIWPDARFWQMSWRILTQS